MKPTKQVFGNKVRIRVCGLCYRGDSILLVKHKIDGDILWAPPGGGVDFGETINDALIREFNEECSITIEPGDFLFLSEYINPPLHAVELFYKIDSYSGNLAIGREPELKDRSIILDVAFFSAKELKLLPKHQLHNIFNNCTNPIQLLDKQGHLKY